MPPLIEYRGFQNSRARQSDRPHRDGIIVQGKAYVRWNGMCVDRRLRRVTAGVEPMYLQEAAPHELRQWVATPWSELPGRYWDFQSS